MAKYSVLVGGKYITVNAQSPIDAACMVLPCLRPKTWSKSVNPDPYKSITTINNTVVVYELN